MSDDKRYMTNVLTSFVKKKKKKKIEEISMYFVYMLLIKYEIEIIIISTFASKRSL